MKTDLNNIEITVNKEIILHQPTTLMEIHRLLQSLMDEPQTNNSILDITQPNPSIRYNDYKIELLDGWHITYNSLKFIKGGIVLQLGEYWSNYNGFLKQKYETNNYKR